MPITLTEIEDILSERIEDLDYDQNTLNDVIDDVIQHHIRKADLKEMRDTGVLFVDLGLESDMDLYSSLKNVLKSHLNDFAKQNSPELSSVGAFSKF